MGYDYIPKYIRQSETKRPKDVITAARWNELFNLLIEQGDYTAEELGKILGYLSSATEDHIDDSTVHVTTADKTAWNGKLDKTGGTVSGDLTVQGNLMLGDCGLAESNTNTISLVGEHEDDNVRLSNLDSPTNDNDAANKKYVDEHAGGGGGGFKITITDNGGSITADKSYAAISAALAENSFVYAMANGQYFAYDKSVSGTRYVFKTVSVNEDGVEEMAYYIDSNDAVSKSTIRYGGRIFEGEIVTTGGAQYLQLEDSGSEIINALADGDVTIRVKSTLTVDDESENLYIPFRPALYGDDSIGTATFIGDFVFLLEARRYQVTISTDDAAGDNIAITDITPSGGIPDAPSDGKQYARQNGAWSEVESGGYEPPADGIPYADLASDVQESLDKADSALQQHQSLAAYRTSAAQDVIDSGKLDTDGDGSNVTAAFTEATNRTNISTGEKLSVMFGKIKKWLADLKTVAFTGSYNDLNDKPTIPTVNDAALTIKQGGAVKGTFSANASSATVINLDAGGGGSTVITGLYDAAGGIVTLDFPTGTTDYFAYINGLLEQGDDVRIAVNGKQTGWTAVFRHSKTSEGQQSYYHVFQNCELMDDGTTSAGFLRIDETYVTYIPDDRSGGGGITDVTVDGASVVTDGVAEIDLTDYAQKDDLDDYVAISQGVANVNKVLAVGSDGNLVVTDITDIIADGDEVSY